MRRALPWLAPLIAAPILALGLVLWRDQGTRIAVSGFIATCF